MPSSNAWRKRPSPANPARPSDRPAHATSRDSGTVYHSIVTTALTKLLTSSGAFLAAAGFLTAQADNLIEVTPETYIRAEADRQFAEVVKMSGGMNRLYHFRVLTPLDQQNIVRMNRDTLYSMGIVDTSQGATITVPELPEGRYASVFLADNDHYCPFVIYTVGKHELPKDTKYLGIGIRIKVFDPDDEEELALVNKLQDQFVIEAGSADPLPALQWDLDTLKELTAQYERDPAAYPSWKGMMGPRGKMDQEIRHIAAAAAWGLFPEWDAT